MPLFYLFTYFFSSIIHMTRIYNTDKWKKKKKVQNPPPSLYESDNTDKGKGTQDFILL